MATTFTKKQMDQKITRTALTTVLAETYEIDAKTIEAVIGEAFTKKGKTTPWSKIVSSIPQHMEAEEGFYNDLLEDLAGTKDEKDTAKDTEDGPAKPGKKTWAAGFTRDAKDEQTPIRKNSLGGQIAALCNGTKSLAEIVDAVDGADEKKVKAQLRHVARTYGYGFSIGEDEKVTMNPTPEFTKPAEPKAETETETETEEPKE